MAGTISLSMSQQLDEFGVPLAAGRLYFIQAGTVSTPQNAFQDSALTLPWPNPFILDASGYVDQLFFADGSIKIRLTDRNGVEKRVKDGLLVVGASSGGGGGSPVDATTVLATGDIKVRYGTGVLAGFVRCNARTLGSATSGASERANSDTQALFEYLWNTDANLTVSTGRGASSIADWSANKTIALPDGRGSVLSALDDMGNTAAGKYTGVSFIAGNATTLGSRLGVVIQTIAQANLPVATLSTSITDTTSYSLTYVDAIINPGGNSGIHYASSVQGSGGNTGVSPVKAGSVTASTALGGSGTPLPTIQPTLLITTYLKL